MNRTEAKGAAVAAVPLRERWLNRNVVGMGVTSLLSDWGHEMATAILPAFMAAIGAPAAALGAIEGIADAVSSFVKLGAGWYTDRIGHRKVVCVGGYFLTGVSKAIFAFAAGWPLVLLGRTLAWFGRGIRGPLRDAMLAESVSEEARGKAFGFHRAGDTLGAILGPLCAVGLLALLQGHGAGEPSAPFRLVFLLTLIPGVGSALAFGLMVRERRRAPNHGVKLWATIRGLPYAYRRWLVGVGVFGIGDFAHTLLILAATQLLTPAYGVVAAAQMAALFYAVRNVLYAGASYPVGALSDRMGRRGILTFGYIIGALTAVGFVAAFALSWQHPLFLVGLFCLAGIYIATEDAIRNRAAEQLGKLGDRRAVEPLLYALPHEGLREAMGALAVFKEGRAIPHIVRRLEDPCDRAAAADALVKFGKMAVPSLTAALAERRPSPMDEVPVSVERRAEAARILGILGDRSLLPILSASLEDPAGIVQLEVALALATLLAADAPGHALAIIPQNLGHPSLPVQMRCLDALVTMGDRAIPHLMARGGPRLTAVAAPRLPSQDALQVTVIEILERIGTEASVRALQDFLRDRSALVRARAQRTLQHPAIGALDSGGDRPALDRPRTNCRGEVSR